MKQISIEYVKYVAHSLAKQTMDWHEPIPEFEMRYKNVLESCVATPFMTINGQPAYKGLAKKSAVLFYLMIKNHPFQNENKRIAVTTLLIFLYLNNRWLKVNDHELYKFAQWVASSPAQLKEEVVVLIESFIKKHLKKLE